MNKQILLFGSGLLAGLVVMLALTLIGLPRLMILTHESRYSVDDTIAEVSRVARDNGWSVPKVYDIQGTLIERGYADAPPIKILSLCQPHHAQQVLSEDVNKRLSSIMPCRFGVYQTADGKVYISGMNIALLSRLFGSAVSEAMRNAATEEAAMLAAVLR
ncbi:MAG: DUF302 domain-containing protein [Sphingobacteriia bacterium]|nr:DUF302 domain-containing protein [Sphingobacteriia bacterium]NCC40317.1 DUF302 domain-containing protein [Gammaproteobacteria bacterium]